jgi:hypothetical protein
MRVWPGVLLLTATVTALADEPSRVQRHELLLAKLTRRAGYGNAKARVLHNVRQSQAARATSRFWIGPSLPPRNKRDPVLRATIGDVIGRFCRTGSPLHDSIFRHYTLEDQRYASRAFHRAAPKLKLTGFSERVLGKTQARDLRTTLQRIERRPVKDWVTALEAAAGRTRSQPRAEALQRMADELMEAYLPKDLEARSNIGVGWYARFITKLLRRHHHWRVDRMLPAELPEPPGPKTRYLRRIVRRARSRGDARRQLIYLERVAARLQTSRHEKIRQRGEQLAGYLRRYKAGWLDGWLAGRMRLYKRANRKGPGWDLQSNLSFRGVGYVLPIKNRLDQAWEIARGLIHPGILKRLPPVKVVVDVECKRATHSGSTITIGPGSGVATILHELGHHIEDHAGLTPFLLGQSLRLERATGAARPLQKLAPGAGFEKGEEAFPSSFKRTFTAKKYPFSSGATEVISMALQRFASPKEARQFFDEDGEYALKVLYALQEKRPWP